MACPSVAPRSGALAGGCWAGRGYRQVRSSEIDPLLGGFFPAGDRGVDVAAGIERGGAEPAGQEVGVDGGRERERRDRAVGVCIFVPGRVARLFGEADDGVSDVVAEAGVRFPGVEQRVEWFSHVAAATQCLQAAPDVQVRRRVAANPNTPAGIVEFLADALEQGKRGEAARNPAAGAEPLTRLAGDPDLWCTVPSPGIRTRRPMCSPRSPKPTTGT